MLFVGNVQPAVQRERLAWLGRLARLRSRWNVVLAAGAFGDEYRALLRRARVVFKRSVRGECNRRTFEAVACGALLFQERDNAEAPAYLRDRQECVYYGDDDLESLLHRYLTREEERRAVAEAARARTAEFGFEALWADELSRIEAELPGLRERVPRRPRLEGIPGLFARTWQALSAGEEGPALEADLASALAREPGQAELHNALGLVQTVRGRRGGPVTAELSRRAAGHFRLALNCDPRHPVAALNLAGALAGAGEREPAADVARRALSALGSSPDPEALDAAPFPPGYDLFRVEWERAAWDHPGEPRAEARAKADLLRWRLHSLLADLTGELPHHYEAVLARPDLPPLRAALGCALGRAGRPAEAAGHLRLVAEANPFDAGAARALWQALTDAGDAEAARRLAAERRLLCEAAPGLVPDEPWFAEARPAGDELASLIVLCCNEVAVTRLCLESVLRHTRPPYELVLVDNGSTDETPRYLDEIALRPGPDRVVVLRNETNRGFAAGCNQALAAARGRYLVLLNNDTVLTAGWLERLVAWALEDWPRVGLVGPVTNYAPPPQLVEPGYGEDLAGLDDFAAQRRRQFAGKALRVERLTGFCLLVRREVLAKVGALDERFGVGFFEDDDLCLRAREAGFELRVALDAYIHHFGSRTFRALGIDTARALEENLQRFRAKWGDERASGYRLPTRETPALPRRRPPRPGRPARRRSCSRAAAAGASACPRSSGTRRPTCPTAWPRSSTWWTRRSSSTPARPTGPGR